MSNQVVEVNAVTQEITVVAGNGTEGYTGDARPASAAELNQPSAVAVDSSGDLFIADTGNNVVREVRPGPGGKLANGTIMTIAGGGTDTSPVGSGSALGFALNSPSGVATNNTDLFISDTGNNVIRDVVLASGEMTTLAGTGVAAYGGDGVAAAQATLDEPEGLAMTPSGQLLIADNQNEAVREITFALPGQMVQVSQPDMMGDPGGGDSMGDSSGGDSGDGNSMGDSGSSGATAVESVSIEKVKSGKHGSTKAIVLQFSEGLDAAERRTSPTTAWSRCPSRRSRRASPLPSRRRATTRPRIG